MTTISKLTERWNQISDLKKLQIITVLILGGLIAVFYIRHGRLPFSWILGLA